MNEVEILCDDCGVWSSTGVEACPECGAERPEFVTFRGAAADRVLLPIALRGMGAVPNEAATS